MPRILVVDDDRAVQEMLVDLLTAEGYEVSACRDGKQVLFELSHQKYDLLILDVLVPHMNGFVLIEKIRQNPDLESLPVIMVSGIYRSRNHRTEMTARFKVIEYLDKPIHTDRLLGLVKSAAGAPTGDGLAPLAAEPSGEWVNSAEIISLGEPSQGKKAEPVVTLSSPKELPVTLTKPKRRESLGKGQPKAEPPPDEKIVDLSARQEKKAVEEEARHSFKTSAFVMQGQIKKLPVVAILGKLWHERATGGLLLRNADVKKIVYLKAGDPVSVKSNLVGECLGQILLRERLINKQECEASIEAMKKTGQRQGEILVQMGCLTPKNLEFALGLQVETKLFETFVWEAGEYRFNNAVEIPGGDRPLGWTGPSVVAEGIRRTFDETRLRSLMLPVIDVPLAYEASARDLDLLHLNEREQKAAAAIISGKNTRQLVDSLPMDPPDALRLVYTLVVLELLKPAPSH
jgi:CheY-like chemotaxis protein